MARILIADDEPLMVELVKMILGSSHSYIVADDGEKAVRLLRKEKPALAILDVMMPGKTGYEVCALMRKDSMLKRIPVIMLSAKASERDIMEGMKAGASAYITKPFEPAKLEAQVKDLL
jgi:putative two-component system response regulator